MLGIATMFNGVTGWPDQCGCLDYLQPNFGFTQLLEHDLDLVDEIAPRLGALCLPIIRGRRGSASDYLAANMIADRCSGKGVGHADYANCVGDQPVFKIE